MTEPAASFWLDRAGSWQPPDPGVLPARADVVDYLGNSRRRRNTGGSY